AAPCPCGSGERFDGCCGPILDGAPAPTAERLMRSRYTAFSVGDVRHLQLTWHPRTRPDELDLDPGLRWTGLDVLGASGGGPDDDTGEVEFRASWRRGRERGELHERSAFVRRGGRWAYVEATD
ncbi:MAG: YchJ family metal-binding protein, partial [Microbacterium sp.]